MSRRRAEIELRGALSTSEAQLAAEDFPDRLAITEAEWNAGARIADDFHCAGCGERGHFFLCPTCERGGR